MWVQATVSTTKKTWGSFLKELWVLWCSYEGFLKLGEAAVFTVATEEEGTKGCWSLVRRIICALFLFLFLLLGFHLHDLPLPLFRWLHYRGA